MLPSCCELPVRFRPQMAHCRVPIWSYAFQAYPSCCTVRLYLGFPLRGSYACVLKGRRGLFRERFRNKAGVDVGAVAAKMAPHR